MKVNLIKSTKIYGAVALALGLGACQTNQPANQKSEPKKDLGIAVAELDSTVDPCDDFYGYIVNGWRENNPIPSTESRWGNFNILVEDNYKKIHGLLDSLKASENLEDGNYGQLVGDYYASAMDSAQIEERGLSVMDDIITKIESIKNHQDYFAALPYFKLKGIRSPFATSVGVDDKDSESYLLGIYQSGLGLPDRDYYLKDDSGSVATQEAYRQHIAAMLQFSGYDEQRAQEQAQAIYQFEKNLAEAQMSRVERRVPENVYNKVDAQELFERTGDLALQQYFNDLGVEFNQANLAQPDYLENLSEIINSADVETLKSYSRWHAIDGMAEYLPQQVVAQNFDFYGKTLYGKKEMKPRWRRSLSTVENALGEQLGRVYVERYFPESSKAEIEAMVEDLRSAYRMRINKLDWMTDSTKAKALEKLEAFNYKIGYPDEWKDYSDLEIKENDFFGNGMRTTEYLVRENFDRLGKKVDKDEWFMPPHIVNAYYSGSYNEIVFPAGILQPPFYSPSTDDAVNYGAIGGVIGHEFTHGFDDRGRKYNAFGNLQNWWTKKDKKSFEKRTNKMVVQYSDYKPLKESFVNGKLTLGENIADLGGLTLAYYAYKNSHVDSAEETPAEIEGFSWDQRIFLGWGRVWQANQTEEYLRNQIVTDSHSPARYRVNGPMSNMPEFKAAWGCSTDDPMVRPDSAKVTIW